MYSEFESASFEPAATGDNQIVETKDLQTDQEGVYATTVAPGDYTIDLILSDIPDGYGAVEASTKSITIFGGNETVVDFPVRKIQTAESLDGEINVDADYNYSHVFSYILKDSSGNELVAEPIVKSSREVFYDDNRMKINAQAIRDGQTEVTLLFGDISIVIPVSYSFEHMGTRERIEYAYDNQLINDRERAVLWLSTIVDSNNLPAEYINDKLEEIDDIGVPEAVLATANSERTVASGSELGSLLAKYNALLNDEAADGGRDPQTMRIISNANFTVSYDDAFDTTAANNIFNAAINARTTYWNWGYPRVVVESTGNNGNTTDKTTNITLDRNMTDAGQAFPTATGRTSIKINSGVAGINSTATGITVSVDDAMRGTLYHEYFHAVQNSLSPGLDQNITRMIKESTAEYAAANAFEPKRRSVVNRVNNSLFTGTAMQTTFTEDGVSGNARIYAAGAFINFIAHSNRLGTGTNTPNLLLVQLRSGINSHNALRNVCNNRGSSLSAEYTDFARAAYRPVGTAAMKSLWTSATTTSWPGFQGKISRSTIGTTKIQLHSGSMNALSATYYRFTASGSKTLKLRVRGSAEGYYAPAGTVAYLYRIDSSGTASYVALTSTVADAITYSLSSFGSTGTYREAGLIMINSKESGSINPSAFAWVE